MCEEFAYLQETNLTNRDTVGYTYSHADITYLLLYFALSYHNYNHTYNWSQSKILSISYIEDQRSE